jgi:phospholipid transport system transporter-binding protein
MAAVAVERTGPGRIEVSGALSFATAAEALRAGASLIGTEPQCTIGLSRVTEGDSAGLAVLLEWLAGARARGASIRYEAVPAQILAVARISDVQDLLTGE